MHHGNSESDTNVLYFYCVGYTSEYMSKLNKLHTLKEFILYELYDNMLDLISKSNVAKTQSLELYKSLSVIPRKYGVI